MSKLIKVTIYENELWVWSGLIDSARTGSLLGLADMYSDQSVIQATPAEMKAVKLAPSPDKADK